MAGIPVLALSPRFRRLSAAWHERYAIRKASAWLLPDRYYAKLAFFSDHGWFPRTPPVTFNERLSDRIGSGVSEQFESYCDKLAVRDFVARKIGANYLVPLHATAERLTADLWDRLPNSFMLKPNHGSGWYWPIRDKRRENLKSVSAVSAKWLKKNYYYLYRERQYRNIKPVLLFEQLLTGADAADVVDYKFFCFHGKAQMVYVLVHQPEKRRLLYDLDWNKLNVRYKVSSSGQFPRPAALEEMRSVAESLAQGFDFVRVDLYCTKEGVLFGELTFVPLAGSDGFDPPEFDAFLGRLWAAPAGTSAMAPWREDAPYPEALGVAAG